MSTSLRKKIFLKNKRSKTNVPTFNGFDIPGLADFIENVMANKPITNEARNTLLYVMRDIKPTSLSDSDSDSPRSDYEEVKGGKTILIEMVKEYILGLSNEESMHQKAAFLLIFNVLGIKWKIIQPFIIAQAVGPAVVPTASTSSQAVLQQQTATMVSPRVEVAPQNVSIPSQQVVDQAASTSVSFSSSFITGMSSHHQASSSNTVTTSQAGHKRPGDADGDSSTKVNKH